MKESKRHISGTDQPRIPSKVAVAARLATGAGKHGKTRRARSKAERRAARREIEDG